MRVGRQTQVADMDLDLIEAAGVLELLEPSIPVEVGDPTRGGRVSHHRHGTVALRLMPAAEDHRHRLVDVVRPSSVPNRSPHPSHFVTRTVTWCV